VEAWRWREALLLLVACELPFGYAAFGLILLAVIAIGELSAGEPVWVPTPFDLGLFALLAVSLVSGMTSEWRANAMASAAVLSITACVVVRAAALASLRRRAFTTWFLGTWAVFGVVASVWAIARLGASPDARAELPGFGFNELGISLAIALVLLMGFGLGGPRRRRLLVALALPVVALGLVLTFSRGAWLAAAIGMAVLVAGAGLRRRWYTLAAVVIPIIVAAPFLAPRWTWHAGRLGDLATTEGPFSRLALWRVVPAIVADHALVGTGLGTFQFAYERYRRQTSAVPDAPFAHNLFLNFAAETGLLGLGALLLMLGGGILTLVRWLRRAAGDAEHRLISAMALAAFATLLAHQMVDGTVLRVHLAIGLFALLGFGAAGDFGSPRGASPRSNSNGEMR
jgi:putative inorganic carbon (HCO3(-)) transporter